MVHFDAVFQVSCQVIKFHNYCNDQTHRQSHFQEIEILSSRNPRIYFLNPFITLRWQKIRLVSCWKIVHVIADLLLEHFQQHDLSGSRNSSQEIQLLANQSRATWEEIGEFQLRFLETLVCSVAETKSADVSRTQRASEQTADSKHG